MIANMKVEELKEILRLRVLKVHSRKEEIVARVFVAQENNVLLVESVEEVQQVAEYSNKLVIEGERLPDPIGH